MVFRANYNRVPKWDPPNWLVVVMWVVVVVAVWKGC